MARRTDKKIDEEYYNNYGVRVEFFLTPDNKFKAKVYGENLVSDDMPSLKRAVYQAVKEGTEFEWIPIIEVENKVPSFSSNTDKTVGMQIHIQRYYVARLANEKGWRDWKWDDRERGYLSFGHWSGIWRHEGEFNGFPFSYREWDREERHFLPYSEELWEGLLKLISAIHALQERLSDLLGTEQGRAILNTVGTKMLLAAMASEVEE